MNQPIRNRISGFRERSEFALTRPRNQSAGCAVEGKFQRDSKIRDFERVPGSRLTTPAILWLDPDHGLALRSQAVRVWAGAAAAVDQYGCKVAGFSQPPQSHADGLSRREDPSVSKEETPNVVRRQVRVGSDSEQNLLVTRCRPSTVLQP